MVSPVTATPPLPLPLPPPLPPLLTFPLFPPPLHPAVKQRARATNAKPVVFMPLARIVCLLSWWLFRTFPKEISYTTIGLTDIQPKYSSPAHPPLSGNRTKHAGPKQCVTSY